MARLFARIALMGLLILLTYGGIWMIPTRSDLVYASLLDKHALLARTVAPRLIFIGGSGIALGLDSELLETRLGLPVINMGVNAGFGLHYMLEEVQPYLQANDIVVIIPEYEHFYGKLLEGDQNLLWALRIRPSSIDELTWQQLGQVLPELPAFFQQRIREIVQRTPDPIYNRAAFNSHGDFVNHLGLPGRTIQPYAIVPTTSNYRNALNRNALSQLAAFQSAAQAKGATVVLIYPAIADNFWQYQNNRLVIEQLSASLTTYKIIRQIAQPSDYVLPEHYFFDTVYHLSAEGREMRSERVAASLERAIPALARLDQDNLISASALLPEIYQKIY